MENVIYQTNSDANKNLAQLEKAVNDAEQLERTSLSKINPLKRGISKDAAKGIPKNYGYYYSYIYDKTLNGYNTIF